VRHRSDPSSGQITAHGAAAAVTGRSTGRQPTGPPSRASRERPGGRRRDPPSRWVRGCTSTQPAQRPLIPAGDAVSPPGPDGSGRARPGTLARAARGAPDLGCPPRWCPGGSGGPRPRTTGPGDEAGGVRGPGPRAPRPSGQEVALSRRPPGRSGPGRIAPRRAELPRVPRGASPRVRRASDAGVDRPVSRISGAMNGRVPATRGRSSAWWSGSPRRATPRSRRTTRPSRQSWTLLGVTSRCTTPAACSAMSPSTRPAATHRTACVPRRPSRARVRSSEVLSRASMTSRAPPSVSGSRSCRQTTFGCATTAAARASRRASTEPSGRCGGSCLTAAWRWSRSSCASQTVLLLPRLSGVLRR
jgi:hypothetical protein